MEDEIKERLSIPRRSRGSDLIWVNVNGKGQKFEENSC